MDQTTETSPLFGTVELSPKAGAVLLGCLFVMIAGPFFLFGALFLLGYYLDATDSGEQIAEMEVRGANARFQLEATLGDEQRKELALYYVYDVTAPHENTTWIVSGNATISRGGAPPYSSKFNWKWVDPGVDGEGEPRIYSGPFDPSGTFHGFRTNTYFGEIRLLRIPAPSPGEHLQVKGQLKVNCDKCEVDDGRVYLSAF